MVLMFSLDVFAHNNFNIYIHGDNMSINQISEATAGYLY